MDFLASRNCFLLFRGFPSSETITEMNGSQFLKKHLILTNVTYFWATGRHSLPFSQTAVNCYQWKQFILIFSIFFSQRFIAAITNDFFVYLKDCFIMKFFLLVKTIFELGKSTFKDGPYFCQSTPIFLNFLRYFLKLRKIFHIFQQIFYLGNGKRFSDK